MAERVMIIKTISATFSNMESVNRLRRIELPTFPRQSVYLEALQMRFILQNKQTQNYCLKVS